VTPRRRLPRRRLCDAGHVGSANVEIVREAMALIRRTGTGQPEARLWELLSPDVTLDMSRRTFNPDVYEGHEGLRRFRRERDEVWEEFLVTPERMIDAGARSSTWHASSATAHSSRSAATGT
jgi:hypothetical protein